VAAAYANTDKAMQSGIFLQKKHWLPRSRKMLTQRNGYIAKIVENHIKPSIIQQVVLVFLRVIVHDGFVIFIAIVAPLFILSPL
jgi:hypothetical protein